MITVIKRDCTEVTFDARKIEQAILKAMKYGSGRVDEQIAYDISDLITQTIKGNDLDEISIYEIENMVFDYLCDMGHEDTAKAYEGYRAVREFQRESNTIDDSVIGLLEGTNLDTLNENSNKQKALISTQRDLIAEEVSKDYCLRKILPPRLAHAHREGIIHIHDLGHFITKSPNCCLINLKDMFENGTVINGKMVETPNSLRTACTIATQIVAQIASGQHGGQTISLAHLAPYVRISKEKIKRKTIKKWNKANINYTEEQLNSVVESDLKTEIKDSIQTLQYQINTLQTSNGQSPFLSISMYILEEPEYEKETVMLIKEVLEQRYLGMKNEKGVYISPAFPKLLYVLDENNIYENSEYFWLSELAAKCVAKRMMPDFLSAKKLKENYEGQVVPPMGCRAFLSPWKDENGEYKLWGRVNMGVTTINLADAGLSAQGDIDRFWDILDERLDMCYEASMIRYNRLKTLTSDASPIHWSYGGLARLPKHSPIAPLLENGRSTITLGYAGIYECVMALLNESNTTEKGSILAYQIMNKLRETVNKWKVKTGLGFALYGTPQESTTEKFAKACRKHHGIIKGITDRDFITNSYHVYVGEEIDAFNKLKFESTYQDMSLGGSVSYIEVPNMSNNISAIIKIMQFMYENIQYAEINTKSDYCMKCGFDGEILLDDDCEWYCPNCGNRDKSEMNVVRRVCGYLGENYWGKGRTEDIKNRVLHL